MERDELKALVKEALSEHGEAGRIDAALHADHHRILAQWIEREEQRRERWEKIRTSVVGGAILAFVIFLGSCLLWIGRMAIAGYTEAQHAASNLPPPHP